MDFLKTQNIVPTTKIGTIGLSQGGNIAPLVANLTKDVAFIVNVVGPPLPAYDVLLYKGTMTLLELGFLPGVSDIIARLSTFILRRITKRRFWRAVGNFEGLPHWRQLTIPALALYGSKDTNVPAFASRDSQKALDNDNITVIIYQGSGHALPEKGNDLFRKEALNDILEFIQSME